MRSHLAVAALPLLATLSACGGGEPYDWKNREISWRYGPTTTAARAEHLAATGKAKNSKGPIAKGWKLRLVDAQKLTVQPYQLSESHESFGAVKMLVNLYDRSDQRIGIKETPAITADNASFTFELTAELAQKLGDVVIWFAPI